MVNRRCRKPKYFSTSFSQRISNRRLQLRDVRRISALANFLVDRRARVAFGRGLKKGPATTRDTRLSRRIRLPPATAESPRTWAPVGSRPRQVVSQRHDCLSVIGSLSLASRRRRIRPHFVVQDRNLRTRDVMRHLRQLHRLHRRPLVVVLDRLAPDRLERMACNMCPDHENAYRSSAKNADRRLGVAPWFNLQQYAILVIAAGSAKRSGP